MNNRPTFRIRRAVAVIAGLAAASVALSGCLYSMIPEQAEPKPSTTNAPDTEGVAEDLLPFYGQTLTCLLYTSPSPRDLSTSRMPSSA